MSADVPVIDGAGREALRLAANALSLFDRAALARSLAGEGERDIDKECGHYGRFVPREVYQYLYDRDPVANRVVSIFPRQCWRVHPSVYEDEDPEVETPFEAAVAELVRSLRPEKSYFRDQQGSTLYDYLALLDEQSGIGQYGVMLLGLDDGLELSQPARLVPGSLAPGVAAAAPAAPGYGYSQNANGNGRPKRKLLYVRIFPESMATISAFETDRRSPRFGQPTEYVLTFNDPLQQSTGAMGMTREPVHWTRVIHVPGGPGRSEVFSPPRMEVVLDRLVDLRKLYGGSGEMYWRGAFPGTSLETHPALGGDVEINEEKVKEMMRLYGEGLKRYLVLTGMSAKNLAPQVVDPGPQIDKQLEAICIQIDVPMRKFKGSERGELSSGQDDDDWNATLRGRQLNYITPRIVVRFFDWLVALGVLPAPEDGYSVSWPDLATRSDEQKAAIAQQRGAAVVAYGNSAGTQDQMTPTDFYVKVMGFTEQEATALVENADKARAERQAEEAKAAAEQARQAAQDHARQLELAKAKQQPPPGPDGPTGPGASGGADGQPPGGGGPGAGTTPPSAGTQNYDPSQPRLPGGGTGAGRWAPGDALAGLGRLDARRHAGTHGPASGDVDPPFAVTDARPWETAAEGLPEEEATLPLATLHAAKPRLSARSLRYFAAGGSAGDAPAPRVWLTPDGRHVIEDGAHRLAAERLRGKGEARVRLVRWQGREGAGTPAGNESGPLTLNADERAALAPEERALWTGLWQERQRLLVRARGLPAGEAGALLAEADGLRARAGALREAVRGRVAGGQS
jgi:uncharacterized protein